MNSFLSKISSGKQEDAPVKVTSVIKSVREHLLDQNIPPNTPVLDVIDYTHAYWMGILRDRTTPGETHIQYSDILYFKTNPLYSQAEEVCRKSSHPLVQKAPQSLDDLKAAFYGLECYKWYPKQIMELLSFSHKTGERMETIALDLDNDPEQLALCDPTHLENVLRCLFPYSDGVVDQGFFEPLELGDVYLRNYHPSLQEPIDRKLPGFWRIMHVIARSLNVTVGSEKYHPYDTLVPILIDSAQALHPECALKNTSIANYCFDLAKEHECMYKISHTESKLVNTPRLGYVDNLEYLQSEIDRETIQYKRVRHLLKATLGPRQIVDQLYFNTVIKTLQNIHGGLGDLTPNYYVSTFVQYLGAGRWTQCPSAQAPDAFLTALEAVDDFTFGEDETAEADPFAEDTTAESDTGEEQPNNDIGEEDTPETSIIDEGGFPSDLEASAYADFLGRLRLLEALNKIISNPNRYGYTPQSVQGMETLVAYHLWILPATDIARLLSTFIRIKDSLKK